MCVSLASFSILVIGMPKGHFGCSRACGKVILCIRFYFYW